MQSMDNKIYGSCGLDSTWTKMSSVVFNKYELNEQLAYDAYFFYIKNVINKYKQSFEQKYIKWTLVNLRCVWRLEVNYMRIFKAEHIYQFTDDW